MLDPAGLERMWLQDVEQPLAPLMVPVEKVNVESVDEDGDEILYFRLAVADDHEIEMGAFGGRTMTDLSLAMANEILERMNWINATQ